MIPKIIHHIAPQNKQVWHPLWRSCYQSWLNQFPENEFELILWNDEEDIDNLIQSSYPNYLQFYNSLPYHIMKIDVSRLLILHKYGGIYSDMDVYCYKNFYDQISNSITLMQAACVGETVQNCLMSSVPNSNFFIECIEVIKNKFFDYDRKVPCVYDVTREAFDDYVKDITGPHILSEIYNKYSYDIGFFPKELYNANSRYYSEELITRHFLTGIWGSEIIKEFIFNTGNPNTDDMMILKYEESRKLNVKNINFYKNYFVDRE